MPALLFLIGPIGRWLALAALLAAGAGWLYLAGAGHERRAAEIHQLQRQERADEAADLYRADGGAAERLRRGAY
jgi:hypothetical protein